MSNDPKQKVPRPTGDTPDEIRALFDQCVRMQRELEETPRAELARQSLFDEQKIPPPPEPEHADPLIWKRRYQELVAQLKEVNGDMFWYWLGQWFKSEGIEPPGDFVPAKVLKGLAKAGRISGADVQNARIVQIWLPYTERLVRKTKWLRQRNEQHLENSLIKLGYASAAVELVTSRHWNSPVEFTCEWVASRSQHERETLRNSYTKFLGRFWAPISKCSFCTATADGAFSVREGSIPCCRRHHPDRLPLTALAAWTDDRGRRWWRHNLDICCIPPNTSR
jgi:hypothetical protein